MSFIEPHPDWYRTPVPYWQFVYWQTGVVADPIWQAFDTLEREVLAEELTGS